MADPQPAALGLRDDPQPQEQQQLEREQQASSVRSSFSREASSVQSSGQLSQQSSSQYSVDHSTSSTGAQQSQHQQYQPHPSPFFPDPPPTPPPSPHVPRPGGPWLRMDQQQPQEGATMLTQDDPPHPVATRYASQQGLVNRQSQDPPGTREDSGRPPQRFTVVVAEEKHPLSSSNHLNPSPPHVREEGEDAEENNQIALLPEDTFSLLVFSRQWVTLGLAFLTPSFQLSTLCILIANVVDIQQTILDDPEGYIPNNPLELPAAVKLEVVFAQLFALLITLLSEDNIKWALNIFISGYDDWLVKHALRVGHAAYTKEETQELVAQPTNSNTATTTPAVDPILPPNVELRWNLANWARFVVGCMSLAATFMLIVQSETVLDVLLNFTAIEFIAQIDNVVFAMAKWGYFGELIKDDATHKICNDDDFTILRTYHCSSDWNFAWNTMIRVVLAVILIGCWFWVLVAQNGGRYLSKEIYVQMGDPSNLSLGTYSGVYVRTERRQTRETRRYGWVAKFGRGEFTYCINELAWIFRDPDAYSADNDNECDWVLRSEETESFDLLAAGEGANWFLREDFNVDFPADQMLLVSYNADNKPERRCASRTTYGLNCEFENVCPTLSIDARRSPFVADREIPTEFQIIEDIEVYDRPVYVGSTKDNQAPYVILFTGRRWILASTSEWVDDDEPSLDVESIAAMLVDFRVHTFPRQLGVTFISAPMDVGSAVDGATPAGISWFAAELETVSDIGRLVNIDTGIDITTKLLCAFCYNSNECFFNAPCVNTQCVCDLGGIGRRCEVAPTGNGFCNGYFNTRRFSYDKGDCCMSSCQNSDSFTCGKTADGLNDIRNVECNQDTASVGWAKAGDSIRSPFAGIAEFGAAVTLASDGTTLLVGATGGDGLVSFLRLAGSEWVPESADIQLFFTDESFGQEVLIAERVRNSISNEVLGRDLLMASFSRAGPLAVLHPFACKAGSCKASSFRERESREVPTGFEVSYSPTNGLQEQDFTLSDAFILPRITDVDFTYPGAISLDGRYLCAGGSRLTVFEWFDDGATWFEAFTLDFLKNADGRVGMVQHVDISSLTQQSDVDAEVYSEYMIAVGLRRYFTDVGLTTETPLEVRVYRWVVGSQPEQIGEEFVSDYHIVADPVIEFLPNAEPVEGTEPTQVSLRDSLHISSDGQVLVYSSFFLADGSGLTFDDIDPAKTNPTEAILMEYDSALQAIVFVRFWDGNEWTLRQEFVLGRKQDLPLREGWITSMSFDASTLAIGTAVGISIYQWNGTAYLEDFSIENEQGLPSISVSGDGSALAVGNPTPGVADVVDVYQNDRYTPCNAEVPHLLHLSLTTGSAPSSTRWSVVKNFPNNTNTTILREGGPASLGVSDVLSRMTFLYRECFALDECSSMSVMSTAASPVDEGTFAAYFRGNELEPSLQEQTGSDCELVLVWSGP